MSRESHDENGVNTPISGRGPLKSVGDYFLFADVRARVRAAFFAAAERADAGRFRAAVRACRESALREAVRCGSRFNALRTARPRRGDGFRCSRPARAALAADFRVSSFPPLGGGSFTPARRALESPIAIACLVERAPCLPSRTCSISS
jgi:hypothetical protein